MKKTNKDIKTVQTPSDCTVIFLFTYLLCAEDSVACVAETGNDVVVVVELFIN